uniref:Uncharacterized protein n=1 Tax=Oncorhynchus kisutch TaxID=8019 RepID=A0A8C7D3F4_ONCKI
MVEYLPDSVLFCLYTAASELCMWTQFMRYSLFDIDMTLFQVERMFPEHVYKNTQSEDVSVVALESLEYMAQLFNIKKLEGCVGCGVGASSGDGGSVTSGKGSLKTYFNKLNTILKQKEHSACAWEITRVEFRDNLVQFKTFLDSRVKP